MRQNETEMRQLGNYKEQGSLAIRQQDCCEAAPRRPESAPETSANCGRACAFARACVRARALVRVWAGALSCVTRFVLGGPEGLCRMLALMLALTLRVTAAYITGTANAMANVPVHLYGACGQG